MQRRVAENAAARRARLRRLRQRRYRQRRATGLMAVKVFIDHRVLAMLVESNPRRGLGWLSERDAADSDRIGQAISQGLARLAEGLKF
jgi:hypothetical protein